MGPAVTLEKSGIGVKRYLPIPQVMPRLAQSTRRHSGSVSRFQDTLKKPHVIKSLRRQWSFDCVLGRGDSGISVEGDELCLFGDVSEIEQFSTPRATVNTNLAGSDCHFEENYYQQNDMGPHDLKANQIQQGIYHVPQHQSVSESLSPVDPITSASNCINKTIQNLESTSVRLTQRISALLRRMKHVHNKGIQLNSEKYVHQLQTLLRREGIPSGDLNHLIIQLSEKIGSCLSKNTLGLLHADSKALNSSFQDDSIYRDVINKYVQYIDPDATDSSSSDDQDNSTQETVCDDSKIREPCQLVADRISDQSANWKHLKDQLISIDEDIRAYRRHFKRVRGRKRKNDGWMVRGKPGSLRFTLTRSQQVSRCLPLTRLKKWKLISINRIIDPSDQCNQCASTKLLDCPAQPSPNRDPYKLSQLIWKRWNGTSRGPRRLQTSKPPEMSHHLHDSSSEFSNDRDNVLKKSKSMTRVHQLLGNQSKREGARSSASKIGGEASRKSNYDINDVIMMPTNSSLKSESCARRKEIDVPTWRYASCHFASQRNEVEDTSDEAFIRRHLQPELTERKHRIPDVPLSHRSHLKTNRARNPRVAPTFEKFGGPSCRGDEGGISGEPPDAFDWSSLSFHSDDASIFHSDDRSLGEVSWFSMVNARSDTSVEYSAAPRHESSNLREGGWKVGSGDGNDDDDSYSTASASSPFNLNL